MPDPKPDHVKVSLARVGDEIVMTFDKPITTLEMSRDDAAEWVRRVTVLLQR